MHRLHIITQLDEKMYLGEHAVDLDCFEPARLHHLPQNGGFIDLLGAWDIILAQLTLLMLDRIEIDVLFFFAFFYHFIINNNIKKSATI